MRGLESVLLIATVGLVGVAAWQWGYWFPGQTPQFAYAARSTVLPADSKEAKGVHHVAKNSGRHSAIPETVGAPEPSLSPDLNPAKKAVVPPPGVPDSETLAVDTTRSELRERYGVPALAVESVRDGSLVERYYYVKPDHANMVVATLRNGKVVSAQTAQLSLPLEHYANPAAR
jgi:hypothetical protein